MNAKKPDDTASQTFNVDPPSGSEIFSNISRSGCSITVPGYQNKYVIIAPDSPDSRLQINSGPTGKIKLDRNGVGEFTVEYRYGYAGDRPDKVIDFVVKDDSLTNIPGAEFDYTFIIRDAVVVIDSPHDFAVAEGGALGSDGFLEVQFSVLDGMNDPVGNADVRVSCTQGNVHFYLDDGVSEITQAGQAGDGSAIVYADYRTNDQPGAGVVGTVKGKICADNVGIFPLAATVLGSGVEIDFNFVLADNEIIAGDLPALKTTFGSTLDLSGPATTFVMLPSLPDGVGPHDTVALLVNGNAVAPFNATAGQLVETGYELPKLPFTWQPIGGASLNGKAFLNYLVQSTYSETSKIQGALKQFTVNSAGGVSNGPNPNVKSRTAPAPTLGLVTVVNVSTIASNVLTVTIDFTGSPVQPQLSGYLNVYVNGYESNTDTSITKQATVPATFTSAAGVVTVDVDATTLWGFSNGAGKRTSNLQMDYYLLPPGVPAAAMQRAGSEEIALDELAASQTYSKISATYVIATL